MHGAAGWSLIAQLAWEPAPSPPNSKAMGGSMGQIPGGLRARGYGGVAMGWQTAGLLWLAWVGSQGPKLGGHGDTSGTSWQLCSSVSLRLFGWPGSQLLRALCAGLAQFML